MSSDNQGSNNPFPNQQRRGSIPPGTSPATSLFQRRNSLAVSMAPPPMFSAPITTGEPGHRRRMSVSASLGLAGSPVGAFDYRRSSTSTTTDSIGESAVEDDDRNSSAAPFSRRMSVQPAARGIGGGSGSAGSSPNTGNYPDFLVQPPDTPVVGVSDGSATPGGPRPTPRRRRHSISTAAGPPFRRGSTSTVSGGFFRFDGSNDRSRPTAAIPTGTRDRRGSNSGVGSVDTPHFATYSNAFATRNQDQGFYDWGAHLRARAQSSVNAPRPVFGTSPPRDVAPQPAAPKTVEMPRPPVQPAPPRPQRAKPDAYQERILKGDFYMD